MRAQACRERVQGLIWCLIQVSAEQCGDAATTDAADAAAVVLGVGTFASLRCARRRLSMEFYAPPGAAPAGSAEAAEAETTSDGPLRPVPPFSCRALMRRAQARVRTATQCRLAFLAAVLTEIYLCSVCSCQEILRRRLTG
jgi:hypothetical protein